MSDVFSVNDNVICSLNGIAEELNKKDSLCLKDLEPDKTLLIIVDIINGFAKEGALSSPRVNAIINPIVKLQKKCKDKNIKILAFRDAHTKDSIEFKYYPEHCIIGHSESEVVDEIKREGIDYEILKNSTNGFLTKDFNKFLNKNICNYKNYIVVGDCTDICVMQFALTLKAYFNEHNIDNKVIVPINAVDTFDLGIHEANLMNIMSLYLMNNNGIEIVKEIL